MAETLRIMSIWQQKSSGRQKKAQQPFITNIFTNFALIYSFSCRLRQNTLPVPALFAEQRKRQRAELQNKENNKTKY